MLYSFYYSLPGAGKACNQTGRCTAATSLTNAFAHRKVGRFKESLDLDAFRQRVVRQSESKLNSSMVAGAMKSIESGEFGQQIVKSLNENGTYELVKQYEKDQRQHLVFRLHNVQLNYHDYELIKKGNEVKIADIIYLYYRGKSEQYFGAIAAVNE